MIRKLVVWNHAWLPFAAGLQSADWQVVSNEGDLTWLLDQLPGTSALLATELPEEALPFARDLRLFLYPGAGVAQTDPLQYPAGCSVVNVYEHEGPIAEYVMMTMLMHVTRIMEHSAAFREGDWTGSGRVGGAPHGELSGKTIGLFGYGHIGQAVARRGKAFGMHIEAVTRRNAAELPDLLRRSDFLVIAAPLTDETRGRFGPAELAMLPLHAFLINVSRAEIVQEQALFEALSSGRLKGAALDVWYQYPQPGAQGFGSELPFHWLRNVIATPHFSAWTLPMILRRVSRMRENLIRLSHNEPLENVVLQGTWK